MEEALAWAVRRLHPLKLEADGWRQAGDKQTAAMVIQDAHMVRRAAMSVAVRYLLGGSRESGGRQRRLMLYQSLAEAGIISQRAVRLLRYLDRWRRRLPQVRSTSVDVVYLDPRVVDKVAQNMGLADSLPDRPSAKALIIDAFWDQLVPAAELAQQEADVLYLQWRQRMSWADIAGTLSVSVWTVRTAYQRALHKVRAFIAAKQQEGPK